MTAVWSYLSLLSFTANNIPTNPHSFTSARHVSKKRRERSTQLRCHLLLFHFPFFRFAFCLTFPKPLAPRPPQFSFTNLHLPLFIFLSHTTTLCFISFFSFSNSTNPTSHPYLVSYLPFLCFPLTIPHYPFRLHMPSSIPNLNNLQNTQSSPNLVLHFAPLFPTAAAPHIHQSASNSPQV